ncbi:MAG: phosphoribosylglycinamide synthetase C domain-containing protein, partial [Acidimicrobiales bacterium]
LAEAAAGRLRSEPATVAAAAVTVVLATEGYPASPRTGDTIAGLDAAAAEEGVTVYCAGVDAGPATPLRGPLGPSGSLITAGGRVLQVTGMGSDPDQARRRAYRAVSHVSWPGMQYRTDIAIPVASSLRVEEEVR